MFWRKKTTIFSATRTCLAKMVKCLSKKPKLLTKWIETLLATLDVYPLETENKKTEWKFRQNIIKRNKKNQPKKWNKLKFSQCLLCCLTISRWRYNCVVACVPASIWQVFLGARCTAQPAGQLYQLLQGCISILPPLSRSKKQWSVVHNSALFLIQEVPNLNLICVLKNMCPKEHFCLLQQIIFFLNFFC